MKSKSLLDYNYSKQYMGPKFVIIQMKTISQYLICCVVLFSIFWVFLWAFLGKKGNNCQMQLNIQASKNFIVV